MHARLCPSAIPHKVAALASALRSAGGRAFLVGGPIRDLLTERTPQDWDIATDLPPPKVLSVFPSAVTVGIEFGRVAVDDVDVVSLRTESGYQDARHPSSVSFGASVVDDLRRRDFTVNAMAAEFPDLEVIDPFGGALDLAARVLRAVGDARERLAEDPLRILRAIRFKTVLVMNMEPSMAALLPSKSALLERVSGERTFAEMKRILLAPGVYQGILDLHGYGLGQVILPEVFSAGQDSIELLARAVSASPPDLVTRLALFFSGGCRTAVERALARLKVESSTRDGVLTLLKFTGDRASGVARDADDDRVYLARRLVHGAGWEHAWRTVDFEIAVWRGQGNGGLPPGTAALAAGMALIRGQTPGPPQLTGDDVMRLTGAEGPAVGDALAFLWDLILKDPAANSKDRLEAALREWWGRR